MLDFSNLNKSDISNLTQLLRIRDKEQIQKAESILLIPGAQQYYVCSSDWISLFNYSFMYGGNAADPPIKTGYLASFLIPNLVVKEPLLVFGYNKFLLHSWVSKIGNKKKVWDVSYVKGNNDEEIVLTIEDGTSKQELKALIIKDDVIDKAIPETSYVPPGEEEFGGGEELKQFYEQNDNETETSYAGEPVLTVGDYKDYFNFGRWMLKTIRWHRKQMEDNSSKVLASFRLPEYDLKLLQGMPKTLSDKGAKAKLLENYICQIGISDGLDKWEKNKIYLSWTERPELELLPKVFGTWMGTFSYNTYVNLIDDVGKNEYLFTWQVADVNSLRKGQEYGVQLFENKQEIDCRTDIHQYRLGHYTQNKTELSLVCFGLTYGDVYYFDCIGLLKQFQHGITINEMTQEQRDKYKKDDLNERTEWLNVFGIRSHKQEKEYQRLKNLHLEREKKHDDFINKFRLAHTEQYNKDSESKLPIKEGELEWMVIDSCWHELHLGVLYYVDEDTYNEELADTMERNNYSKEDVLFKQDFLTKLPDLLANKDKVVNKELINANSPSQRTDETNLAKEIETLKGRGNELKGLLEILKK